MRRRPVMRGVLAAIAAAGLIGAACNGEADVDVDGGGDGGAEGAATVQVTLREWEVVPDTDSVTESTVEFEASNEGTQPHELVVIRTELAPDALPVEGGAVVEEGGELSVVGEIEEFEAGATQSGEFELESGSYVLICNIPGHYEQGMRSSFAVQ